MFRLSRKKKKLGQHLSAKGFRSLNRGESVRARARVRLSAIVTLTQTLCVNRSFE